MSRPALNSWVTTPRPNPAARLRLFCFPYAGAGASIFYPWTRELPAEVEVCPVQLPGREGRMAEKPFDRMDPLVETLAEVLAPHMDRPFAFFGHSNGAIMSFELARLLRREGRRMPEHVFLSGRPASHVPSRHPQIHHLPQAEFEQELRRLQGTPEEILQNREIMELITPLLRADFALAETYAYRPEAPLDVPVSAYGGARDADVPEEDVAAWKEHAAGPFHLRIFPGDHFFINGDRALVLRELARELTGIVARLAAAPANA
jgi:medium-chain acyl-[acyl-carrier-protein] hydrolase